MSLVPRIDTGLVAFPTEQEGRIASFPAFKRDLPATFFAQRLNEFCSIFNFVLVHSANIVRRLACKRVLVRVGLRIDDSEELCAVDFVLGAGVDNRRHFCGCGVANDNAIATCRAQGFGRSSHLLGDMTLVDIHDVDIQCFGCCIQNALALAAERVGGTPDRHTDERLFARFCLAKHD